MCTASASIPPDKIITFVIGVTTQMHRDEKTGALFQRGLSVQIAGHFLCPTDPAVIKANLILGGADHIEIRQGTKAEMQTRVWQLRHQYGIYDLEQAAA